MNTVKYITEYSQARRSWAVYKTIVACPSMEFVEKYETKEECDKIAIILNNLEYPVPNTNLGNRNEH